MKSYRRILVPIAQAWQGESLLHTLRDFGVDRQTKALAIRLIEPDIGFEPDGPAASLPGEYVARRAIDAQRRMELQLARMDLGWVDARVVWQNPTEQFRQTILEWQPDLIIADRETLADCATGNADLLHPSGRGLATRLAEALSFRLLRHA